MLNTQTQTPIDVQSIINAFVKKKKCFNNRVIKQQAFHFSPTYRDFISKVINNSSLKIFSHYKESFTRSVTPVEYSLKSLSKRQINEIYNSFDSLDSFPHELGHAVDFWFGKRNALTTNVIIEDNQTLFDIFTEEFEEKSKEIYETIMNEYRESVNKEIRKDAFDILMSNIHLYRKLNSLPCDLNNKEITTQRRAIQKKLYESDFVEIYYRLDTIYSLSEINSKYSPILDALSSKYNLEDLYLDHHQYSYYEDSKYKPIYEFFANLFAAEVTSKFKYFEHLNKFLPKSFAAFEKLFEIFYSHIQNNKRFNDVPVRKRGFKYEL